MMFPEPFDMNDAPINLTKKRCVNLVEALNLLSSMDQFEVFQDPVTTSYHVYDSDKDLIYTTGKQIVGAFQFYILNWKEDR